MLIHLLLHIMKKILKIYIIAMIQIIFDSVQAKRTLKELSLKCYNYILGTNKFTQFLIFKYLNVTYLKFYVLQSYIKSRYDNSIFKYLDPHLTIPISKRKYFNDEIFVWGTKITIILF